VKPASWVSPLPSRWTARYVTLTPDQRALVRRRIMAVPKGRGTREEIYRELETELRVCRRTLYRAIKG
jgi:hypothetical protein